MIRAILLLILLVVVLAFLGYRVSIVREGQAPSTAGTPSSPPHAGTNPGERTGSKIGEKVADAANSAEEFVSEAAITAKIKAKMALDDLVKAADIHVETARGGVVTLTGTASSDQHRRAVALARETQGVTRVVDRIRVVK
jgi:hyperosmotically inducible protein